MFRVFVSDAFWWTVQIPVPTDDGWVKQPLEVQFKHFTSDGFEELMATVRREKLTDPQLVTRVLLDWRKVASADGAALPFSPDALQQLCRTVPGAAECLVRDWIDCHARVATKN